MIPRINVCHFSLQKHSFHSIFIAVYCTLHEHSRASHVLDISYMNSVWKSTKAYYIQMTNWSIRLLVSCTDIVEIWGISENYHTNRCKIFQRDPGLVLMNGWFHWNARAMVISFALIQDLWSDGSGVLGIEIGFVVHPFCGVFLNTSSVRLILEFSSQAHCRNMHFPGFMILKWFLHFNVELYRTPFLLTQSIHIS